jgi:hypothetical protein
MPISKCIVRLKDCHDTEHSVVVYAETLYEAVLRGLSRLEDVGWESNTGETIQRVEVEIHQEPTRHIVDVPKLLRWVQEDSMYPAQQTRKEKLRKLLTPQVGRFYSQSRTRSVYSQHGLPRCLELTDVV